MADNPYRGQHADYEQAWDLGYKYGYDNPHVTDYQPVAATLDHYWPGPVYNDDHRSWLKQIWAEGALAGQKDGLQQGHAVRVSAEHSEHHEVESLTVVGVEHGVEGGAEVVAHVLAEGEISLGVVAAGVGMALFVGAILFVVTGEGTVPPEEAYTDPDQLGAFLAKKCIEAGCSEFFLPYCTATGHAGGSDDIFNAGLWHGPLYYNQDNAFGDAQQHVINEHHWGHTGILHYLPAEPNYMGWMALAHT